MPLIFDLPLHCNIACCVQLDLSFIYKVQSKFHYIGQHSNSVGPHYVTDFQQSHDDITRAIIAIAKRGCTIFLNHLSHADCLHFPSFIYK